MSDPNAWVLSYAHDPFPEHAAAYASCDIAEAGGFYTEGVGIEVDTGKCGYLVLEQPVLVDIKPGDTLSWSAGHYELIADAPASAHLAVALGDDVLWEWNELIPAPLILQDITVEAPSRAKAGTPLVIHLHNHGQNTWIFTEDEMTPRE